MTSRLPSRSTFFYLVLSATIGLFQIADADARDSSAPQTAYWCEHDNGAVYAQREPCAPGKQVRTGEIVEGSNGLIRELPVEGTVNTTPSPDPPPVAPHAPVGAVSPDVAEKSSEETLREGQYALLKLLGFGLVFGVLAKMQGRSFWLWATLGAVLRIALVSLGLMKF